MGWLSRLDAASKTEVLRVVSLTQQRSHWSLEPILAALSVPRSVYFKWRSRAKHDRLHDTPPVAPRLDAFLPEEERAICDFALQHAKVGYRKLTWMMIDQSVAYASESSTYRVLDEADLLARWKRSERSSGEHRFRPTAPNQQWHTDVMYVWVACRYYFLLNFVDAFSRYVVHHRLRMDLNGTAVATELEGASPLLQRMSSALTKASRTVAVVDSAYNLVTGLELLFSDEGAVAYELRHGRSVRAQALRAKGVVQLASAATGGVVAASSLVLFGGGSAAGLLAVTGPLGLALVAGGLLIVCIDASLELTQEFAAQTAALEQALDVAERAAMVEDTKTKVTRLKLADTLEHLQQRVQAAKM